MFFLWFARLFSDLEASIALLKILSACCRFIFKADCPSINNESEFCALAVKTIEKARKKNKFLKNNILVKV